MSCKHLRKVRSIDGLASQCVDCGEVTASDRAIDRLKRIESIIEAEARANDGSAARVSEQLSRIEAMLAKLTQAPALIPATRANIVKALRDAGYTNLAAMANTMTDKELGIDPHTDDAETEQSLGKSYTPRDRWLGTEGKRIDDLRIRMDAEQHANATLIAELRERVEKLEARLLNVGEPEQYTGDRNAASGEQSNGGTWSIKD